MLLKCMAAFDHLIASRPVLVLHQIDPPVRLKHGAFRERIYIGYLFAGHPLQIMVDPFVLPRGCMTEVLRMKNSDRIAIVISLYQNSSGTTLEPLDHFGGGGAIVYHIPREAEKVIFPLLLQNRVQRPDIGVDI